MTNSFANLFKEPKMIVSELIEALQTMDADAEVHFQYNYGDHWRTQVAPTVDEVEAGYVEYSTYHSMDAVANEEESWDEETGAWKEDVRKVVILG
jgi:hypothetical protein